MINNELKQNILILDGAMGTCIQKYALTEQDFRGTRFATSVKNLKGNNDLLNLTAPHIIEAIHSEYIAAGADIIETNTFNSNVLSQEEYGCGDIIDELNRAGVAIAKQAIAKAGRKVYIAGSVGPTGKTLSLAPDITKPEYRPVDFDTLSTAYYNQIYALVDAGVDLLLLETVFDALNAKAALYAITKVEEQLGHIVPVMLSATINDKSGRTLTGQCIDALFTSISHYPLLSFGLNCSFGASDLYPFIAEIAAKVPCAVSIYPNAGLPNEMGEYDEKPEYTAACLGKMAADGLLNIAGGCCGTTPAHIKAIKEELSKYTPRVIPQRDGVLRVSGLENVTIDKSENFINVGERTNVAGSRKFARLISEKKYAEAISIARQQIEEGASIIDINMDDAMLDSEKEMVAFVRILNNEPDVAKAALMIDSSNWDTLIAGLKNAQGKSIVNSISLKEGEEEFIKKAKEIHSLGAAVVVMAFDEEGQAVTFERKIEIAQRAYTLLTEQVGFAPEDIIFDVNVLSVGTGIADHNNYGVDFIKAVEWIKLNLPGAKCSGGVSNLSFAFRGNNPVREAMHSIFLYHAIQVGMDMAIVNPGMLQVYDTIEPTLLKLAEDVILNRDTEATDKLITLAEEIKNNKQGGETKTETAAWRTGTLAERLSYALVKGISDYLPGDIAEALAHYATPVDIIEGPLMAGMDHVGELFGSGKMFLPQVVKSARIMKEAVEILEPEIEKHNINANTTERKPRVVLATAKGDVHDIGKNIVSIVLNCNNLEILDLGVMVDNNRIIEAAKEWQADIIGVSGLITPSLKEMENLAELLEREGMSTPLLVGGATTSKLHTAVKIAPKYSAPVIEGGDASQTVGIIKRLLGHRIEYAATVREEQEKLRKHYEGRSRVLLPLEVARERRLRTTALTPLANINTEPILSANYCLSDLVEHIDWTPLLHFWGFKGHLDKLLVENEEALKLYNDAQQELKHIIEEDSFQALVSVNFFDATAENETIRLSNGESLEMLRQQSDETTCYSLSDFYAKDDVRPIGLFVLAVKDKVENEKDDFRRLLRASIASRLTEALAEHLHQRIAGDEPMIRPAFGYSSCPDHSLKGDVFRIMEVEDRLGLTLTESYGIQPSTAICGLFIPHPEGRYFSINNINDEQWDDYAKRKAFTEEEMTRLLGFLK
ncbi:MAG: methionine synthase [Marinifilaceae bacterium]